MPEVSTPSASTRAAAAAEVAHLGGGEAEAVLARAGEDRRHRGARPVRHRLAGVAVARQQQLREAAPDDVDRHDHRRDRRHRARRRVGAVVDRARLGADVDAVAHAAVPRDIPAQVDVDRGEHRCLQARPGRVDEATRVGAGAGEVEREALAGLAHRADDPVDLGRVAVVVDVLHVAPLAVGELREPRAELLARVVDRALHHRLHRRHAPLLDQLEDAAPTGVQRRDLAAHVEAD